MVKERCHLEWNEGSSLPRSSCTALRMTLRPKRLNVTIGAVTCPVCKTVTSEEMPEDACVHFFVCPACQTRLTPKQGDCCVFCSYGDHQCPPKLAELGHSKLVD